MIFTGDVTPLSILLKSSLVGRDPLCGMVVKFGESNFHFPV